MIQQAATRDLRPRVAGRLRRLGRGGGPAILAVIALILVSFVVPSGEVQARSHPKAGRPTVLGLTVPATVELGAHAVVTVRLTASGNPVRGKLISVHLGGKVSQQVKTGADGTATAEIDRDLSAGRYKVTATFAGTAAYRSSSSPTAAFTVTPVQLTIATVPPTPGLPLVSIDDGTVLTTGPDGTVVVTMTKVGRVALRLALPADDATRRVRLARWDDGSTDDVHTIRIPDTLKVVAGLQILNPVQFEFASADGAPIGGTDVPIVRVSDDAGKQETLTGTGPLWLRSNAITRLITGLDSQRIEYRIAEVSLGGVNVVNRGQQRFSATGPQTVKVPLLVFNLVVQGRDALLKTPSGSQATITDPAGAQRVLQLDDSGSAAVSLPRGEYNVVIDGGPGIPITTPVTLSRDQRADVLSVSLLDIGLVAVVGLSLVFGLILLGRPHVLRRRRGDSASGSEGPGPPVPQWPEPAAARDWRPRPRP